MRWTVLVPARALPAAKSRLAGATPDTTAHRRLVEAIRSDTLAAARAAAKVARVVVVTDVAPATESDTTFVQSEPGLNPGLREAAAYAAARWPGDGVAALVADLPALQTAELDEALAAAAAAPRCYAADAAGTGTTLLTARPGVRLDPRFGAGSAARHAADAAPLPAGPGLRQDVDTPADLAAAAEVGLGPATRDSLRSPARGIIAG